MENYRDREALGTHLEKDNFHSQVCNVSPWCILFSLFIGLYILIPSQNRGCLPQGRIRKGIEINIVLNFLFLYLKCNKGNLRTQGLKNII